MFSHQNGCHFFSNRIESDIKDTEKNNISTNGCFKYFDPERKKLRP